MIFETTSTNYKIPLKAKEFNNINDLENITSFNLFEKLNNIEGVSQTDYNGHFGSFIYLTIDKEFDTDKIRDKISLTIKTFIFIANLCEEYEDNDEFIANLDESLHNNNDFWNETASKIIKEGL